MGGTHSGLLAMVAAVAAAIFGTSAPIVASISTASTTLSNPLPGADRLPNGWALDPAGTQVLTDRAPTGLTVSPDGTTVYAVTSGIFNESIDTIDTSRLVATPTSVSSAFQGVVADGAGHVWVSSGPSNRVFEYLAAGPTLVDVNQAGAVPSTPNRGTAVTGYPGNMLLEGGQLFVAGSISVPQSVAEAADGGVGCPASDAISGNADTICSVVNVVDESNPTTTTTAPAVHAIPVGRDAYGLAYRPGSITGTGTLYVSNFADQTNPNPSRGAGSGTVSVVTTGPGGTGSEAQVVPVGAGPAGVALSPDRSLLAVANSNSDTISILSINTDGSVDTTKTQTVSVGLPGGPLGTAPLAVTFTPDGKHLVVALAGIDALEVLAVAGGVVSPIAQSVNVSGAGSVEVPATFIPSGWYPDALATGPEPAAPATGTPVAGTRLYVANLKGNGAGPGLYEQLTPQSGSSTEGTVSAIDLPTDAGALASALATWTAQVVAGDKLAPVYDAALAASDPATNPCAAVTVPGEGPIVSQTLCQASKGQIDPHALHVVTILAENKTFDSYFGDTALALQDNGDPAYTEFGAAVTTNQHRLASQFTLSDDFWNEGAESSVLGHSWWAGGVATPDNELTWGQSYDQGLRGGRSSGQYAPGTTGSVSGVSLSGPSDPAVGAAEGAMLDPSQVLADEVGRAGLSTRVYATDVSPSPTSPSSQNQVPQGPWGEGSQSPVSSDLAFPDSDRANIFIHGQTISHAWDLFDGPQPPSSFGKPIGFSTAAVRTADSLDGWTATYAACMSGVGATDAACQGQSMPNYVYMTLPENHTYVVSNVFNPLDPTPQSMVADNDYAIGKVVDALSKSPFWKNTVVFVSEDDTQFTGDHVDIHRTFLLTTGGLAKQLGLKGQVSHQQGSFASVLKTTEVLLGLKPLTLFDRLAVPLQDVIADAPNGSSYDAVVPPTPFLGNSPLVSVAGGSAPAIPADAPGLLGSLGLGGVLGLPGAVLGLVPGSAAPPGG
ncbi:MAG: YncE family protein [Acidimicrobiales bacterium]